MLAKIIELSARNKFLVFLAVTFLVVWGVWAVYNTPLDAIPDLSDAQVIIFTEWAGRSPDLVEDQITYPIVSTMLAAPKVRVVRGKSFLGLSFVYVIFEDGTDIYWARSRVLEYLQGVTGRMPAGVTPVLGPDATGVGWGFQYAVVDETGKHDLAQLRSLQDWTLKYAVESVPGVSEVASVGGFVKQYQVTVDPNRLAAYNVPIMKVMEAVKRSNSDVEGRVLELSGVEYMLRGRGYIKSTRDLETIPVGAQNGIGGGKRAGEALITLRLMTIPILHLIGRPARIAVHLLRQPRGAIAGAELRAVIVADGTAFPVAEAEFDAAAGTATIIVVTPVIAAIAATAIIIATIVVVPALIVVTLATAASVAAAGPGRLIRETGRRRQQKAEAEGKGEGITACDFCHNHLHGRLMLRMPMQRRARTEPGVASKDG